MNHRCNARFASCLGVYLLFHLAIASGLAVAQSSERAFADAIIAKLQANQPTLAVEQAQLGLQEYPRSELLFQLLGSSLAKCGRYRDARSAFQRAIDLAPQDSANYYNVARVDLELERWDDMVDALRTFLSAVPNDAPARILLGRAYYNLGQTLLSIEEFQHAIKLNDGLPLAHFHLGFAEASLGNRDFALKEFEREIEISPMFYDSYLMAGKIELESGNLDHAQHLYRRAILLRPERALAHAGLARVLQEEGSLSAAEAEFQTASKIDPNNVESHYRLAKLYQRMGKPEDAKREFEAVTKLHAESAQ
jgi:tetratricopeptide (TPR) repeat protein